MNRSSDQPETSGHGYTEDDVRIVAESLRFAATEPYGDLLMNADRAAGLAVAALAAAGRLRDTRDDATDFAAISGYDLGIEEGRRQMEVGLRAAGRLLPADTRTEVEDEIEWRTSSGAVDTITYTDYDDAAMTSELDAARTHGSQMLSRRKRSVAYFADGSTLVGPWVPVSPNPEITDTPTGAVSGNSDPAGPPDTKEDT